MAKDYVVQQGDCMSSIAYENGFFWETLWNLPENAELKAKRVDPNVLTAGDIVHIPDQGTKQHPGPTNQRHKFKLNGVPETLSITLLDNRQKPRPNTGYIIVIDGDSRRGRTDSNGELKQSIPPNAKSGELYFLAPLDDNGKPARGEPSPGAPNTKKLDLQLGGLDPVSSVSGLKSRLANLGVLQGADRRPDG